MSALNAPHLHDEAAAYAHVEARLWPTGRICPHCGTVDRSGPLKGKTNRIGLYKCYACRKPFSVKVGTIFEASHIPMHVWLQAMYLMASSKKGISTHQLHRTLGITLKSAWFLSQRIREAMKDIPGLVGPLGGEGSTVEIDETYIGGKAHNRHLGKRGAGKGREVPKAPVFALVERNGRVRAYHVPEVTGANLREIVGKNVKRGTKIHSDDNHTTRFAARDFDGASVNHKDGEYVRGDVHSNTIEGYFAILKRGLMGVYHHVSEAHLARYLSEFDFRYSNRMALGIEDAERAERIVRGVVGKRLTYRTTRQPFARA